MKHSTITAIISVCLCITLLFFLTATVEASSLTSKMKQAHSQVLSNNPTSSESNLLAQSFYSLSRLALVGYAIILAVIKFGQYGWSEEAQARFSRKQTLIHIAAGIIFIINLPWLIRILLNAFQNIQ